MNIDKQELFKGYISKKRTGYIIQFWDTLRNENIYLGYADTFDDGYDKYVTYQHTYYKDKNYLLPKFISLDYGKGFFNFQIHYKHKNGENKKVYLYSAKSLQEVIEYRKQFIANLL